MAGNLTRHAADGAEGTKRAAADAGLNGFGERVHNTRDTDHDEGRSMASAVAATPVVSQHRAAASQSRSGMGHRTWILVTVMWMAGSLAACSNTPAAPSPAPAPPPSGTRLARETLNASVSLSSPECSDSFRRSVDESYFAGGT